MLCDFFFFFLNTCTDFILKILNIFHNPIFFLQLFYYFFFKALAHAQCAGFICIIVVQWADLMICKTRWLSIREQGMVNPVMNFGLLFETILGCFLCYIPGLGDVLGTRPIRFQHWFPGMPFCLVSFFFF